MRRTGRSGYCLRFSEGQDGLFVKLNCNPSASEDWDMGVDRLVAQGVSLHINFVSISQSRIGYQGGEIRNAVVVKPQCF